LHITQSILAMMHEWYGVLNCIVNLIGPAAGADHHAISLTDHGVHANSSTD
jgi:hypothetical protein